MTMLSMLMIMLGDSAYILPDIFSEEYSPVFDVLAQRFFIME